MTAFKPGASPPPVSTPTRMHLRFRECRSGKRWLCDATSTQTKGSGGTSRRRPPDRSRTTGGRLVRLYLRAEPRADTPHRRRHRAVRAGRAGGSTRRVRTTRLIAIYRGRDAHASVSASPRPRSRTCARSTTRRSGTNRSATAPRKPLVRSPTAGERSSRRDRGASAALRTVATGSPTASGRCTGSCSVRGRPA